MTTSDREYDSAVAHTIWELERSVKRGRVSDATRRILVEAHAQQLQTIEERAGVGPDERSFVMLQPNIATAILMLPSEGRGCGELKSVGRFFHRAGFSVLATSLAYREVNRAGYSPQYWQTCLDESLQRYDMLNHYASRMLVLGVGLSATIALHVAVERKVAGVIALFPKLHADIALRERLRIALDRFLPRRQGPAAWAVQRRFAADAGRQAAAKVDLPMFVVVDADTLNREESRSVRTAKRLLARRAEDLREVPTVQASPEQLPELVLEDIARFARRR